MYVSRSAIAATKVGFVNMVQATNVKLSVSVVNTSVLEEPLDIAYDYFNVTLSGLFAHELKEAWIEFRLNTSWIEDNDAAKGDVRLKRYRGTGWEELPTFWVKDTETYSYFNASTPGFSIFAIALAVKEPIVEPEPEINITEPEPEANITEPLEPEANATEQPEPPVEPRKKGWLVPLLVLVILALGAGYFYVRQRR